MADKAYKPNEKFVKIYEGGGLAPPKFMPSYYEWISARGKVVNGFKSVTDSTSTLYTVPENKVFFLISISMMSVNDAAISISNSDFEVDDVPALTIQSGKSATGVGNESISFSIPMRLEAGKTLKIRSNRANCWVRCCYFGYEVDKKDSLII